MGGGLEVALACDIRVAAEDAKLGMMEVRRGRLGGSGGTQRLPRLIGTAKALELCLTGELVDAAEAFRLCLVNRVVPVERLIGCRRRNCRENLPRRTTFGHCHQGSHHERCWNSRSTKVCSLRANWLWPFRQRRTKRKAPVHSPRNVLRCGKGASRSGKQCSRVKFRFYGVD